MTDRRDPVRWSSRRPSTDKVTLTGALPSYSAERHVRLYGRSAPWPSIRLRHEAGLDQSRSQANGPGSYTTPAATLIQAGLLPVPGESRPPTRTTSASTTPCKRRRNVCASGHTGVHTVRERRRSLAATERQRHVTVSGCGASRSPCRRPCTAVPCAECDRLHRDCRCGRERSRSPPTARTRPRPTPDHAGLLHVLRDDCRRASSCGAVKTPCGHGRDVDRARVSLRWQTQVSSQRDEAGRDDHGQGRSSPGSEAWRCPVQVGALRPVRDARRDRLLRHALLRAPLLRRGDGTTPPPPCASTGPGTTPTAKRSSPRRHLLRRRPPAPTARRRSPTRSRRLTTITSNEVVRARRQIFDRVRSPGSARPRQVSGRAVRAVRDAGGDRLHTRLHGSTVARPRAHGVS
jgi:hypothetical protein